MFARQNRLTKKKEFDNVFKKGRSSYDQILGIKMVPNELSINRFGIIISNKVSKKAVVRNKIKRRLREILKEKELKQGHDILIITLPKVVETEFADLKKSVNSNLKRLRLDKNV